MHPKQPKDLLYPLLEREVTWRERWAIRLGRWPGFCTVCGRWTVFRPIDSNFRECCLCSHCRSSNRQRQLAWMAARCLGINREGSIRSLMASARLKGPAIYNTESSGPIHNQLAGASGYVCSEYFGERHQSGDVIRGVLHQDLQNCSFPANFFDLVLSCDVLEHIPDPYRAHQEIYRILKEGGRHLFTAPFYQTRFQDEIRSQLDQEGNLVHFHEPWYHDDPMRPDQGTLVYRVFSMEMLVRLEEIGFHTRFYRLYSPKRGIFGANALVFEAIK